MGMPLVSEVKNDPTQAFYMCRICTSQIALSDSFNYYYTPETGLTGGVFDEVVNVHVKQSAQLRKVGLHTTVDAYCLGCGNHLGWKFVKISKEDPSVEENMILLPMAKLLMWDGHQMVSAEAT
ncbi:hypothetical protein Leryth_009557 [Lithospermum erythrorhizon]|nr:hypothetical protein Leryth_009557 [Lithospermum erythrorhizon]